jgi:ankyrin repeat protein
MERELVQAINNNHIEKVQLLLQDPRINLADNCNEALMSVILKDRLEIMKLLLQHPQFNPFAEDNFVMRWAVIYERLSIIELLVSSVPGILVSTVDSYLKTRGWYHLEQLAKMTGCLSRTNEDLLVWAAAIGSINLVKELIRRGVDPTFANNSAVVAANQYGHQDIVNYLLTLPGVHL